MSIRVEFEGGPADGAVTEYPRLEIPLPSLYWEGDESATTGIYHRAADAPDPSTGAWRYRFSEHRRSTAEPNRRDPRP